MESSFSGLKLETGWTEKQMRRRSTSPIWSTEKLWKVKPKEDDTRSLLKTFATRKIPPYFFMVNLAPGCFSSLLSFLSSVYFGESRRGTLAAPQAKVKRVWSETIRNMRQSLLLWQDFLLKPYWHLSSQNYIKVSLLIKT